jgi:predicted MPP superfamily phosphohydrolase
MLSRPLLQEYDIGVPAEMNLKTGFRILHFGDLHWRSRSPGRLERRVKQALESTPADLVVFSGDTVNRHRSWQQVSRWLSDLQVRGPRFAVPGNWDYSRAGLLDEFTEVWEQAGFQVLRNRALRLDLHGQALDVVGFADARQDSMDWRLVEKPVPDGVFRLLLSHNPDVLLARDRMTFHLLLSGHTHGGQIRLPGIGALVTSTRLGRKFDKGLFRLAPTQYVFITCGIGTGDVPLRVCCPPELALLNVCREESLSTS